MAGVRTQFQSKVSPLPGFVRRLDFELKCLALSLTFISKSLSGLGMGIQQKHIQSR